MSDSDRELISERRRLLQNPYAYVEHLVASESNSMRSSSISISESRRLLENPYAYLDGSGKYVGASAPPSARPSRWTDGQIEAKAREIHVRLWREREMVWDRNVPTDPVELLDPEVALRMLGFDFEFEEGLGQVRGRNGMIEVAGLIDTHAKVVRVGRQFPAPVRTFTMAHELGHAALHPSLGALHRDRPLDGSPISADRIESEANKFATVFLMPAKLVCTRFAEVFRSEFFELTEETAFAVAGCSLLEFKRRYRSLREISRLLSGAERYDGRHVVALHKQFRVSREPMAIRLEELGLVRVAD